MGGDKQQIAESAAQAFETYRHAKEEFENIEKLAQVQGPHMSKKTLLTQIKAPEIHAGPSQRPLAAVSTVHYSTSTGPILLSPK